MDRNMIELLEEYIPVEDINDIIHSYHVLNVTPFSSFEVVQTTTNVSTKEEQIAYNTLMKYFVTLDEIMWQERIKYQEELFRYKRKERLVRRWSIVCLSLFVLVLVIFAFSQNDPFSSQISFELVGEEVMYVQVGEEFYDPGVSDNDPSNKIHQYQTIGTVDVTVEGTYEIQYIIDGYVTDLTRTVHVYYDGEQKLKLLGPSIVYLNHPSEYVEYGVSLIGSKDRLNGVYTEQNFDDTSVDGEYQVLYRYGNINTLRTVVVNNTDVTHANVAVFVGFAEEEYQPTQQTVYYEQLFNGDIHSVQDYFLEVSYQQIYFETYFVNSLETIYTLSHPRAYYQKQTDDNVIGYQNLGEAFLREQELLLSVIDFVSTEYNTSVELDYNGDFLVDSFTLLFTKQEDNWSDLLWPHHNELQPMMGETKIGGLSISDYVFLFLDFDQNIPSGELPGVYAHELFHVFNAPDLYHYYKNRDIEPVGEWGLMGLNTSSPVVHILQYMKEEYGGIVIDKTDVYQSGTYLLNKTTKRFDHAIEIHIPNEDETYWLEYRTRDGFYEKNIQKEGVILYRVNPNIFGNTDGLFNEDVDYVEEVFVFRPTTFIENILPIEYYIIKSLQDVEYAAMRPNRVMQIGINTEHPIYNSKGELIPIGVEIKEYYDDYVMIDITFY